MNKDHKPDFDLLEQTTDLDEMEEDFWSAFDALDRRALAEQGQAMTISASDAPTVPTRSAMRPSSPTVPTRSRPVTEGYRLCLVYNLSLVGSLAGQAEQPRAPRTGEIVAKLARVLGQWDARQPLEKLVIPLEHQYTQAGLETDAMPTWPC